MMKPVENQQRRILVVDDKASDTQLIKLSLERTNDYIVKEENDAKAAIAAAEAFQPHLILLDVMMPDIDGGELAAVFQNHPLLKSIPIIFLTAAVTHKEVDAGRGLVGGRPFLAKPIVLTELLACLDQQLKPKPVTVQ